MGEARRRWTIDWLFAFCIGMCALQGRCVGVEYGRDEIKKEAVQLGYAEHHATTGEWQWKPTPTPPHLTPEAGGPE